MKTITVAQPYASLIVAGIKTIETRPFAPNGSMRPEGQRGQPGKPIEPGERIAIHAAAPRPVRVGDWIPWQQHGEWCVQRDTTKSGDLFASHATVWTPLGAIVGTVVVADVVPIKAVDDTVSPAWCPHIAPKHNQPDGLWHWRGEDTHASIPIWDTLDISDQLPLGDYRPGRWGWLLTDPRPTTVECPTDCTRFGGKWPGWKLGSNWDWVPCPVCGGETRCDQVPARGRQGVWEWSP